MSVGSEILTYCVVRGSATLGKGPACPVRVAYPAPKQSPFAARVPGTASGGSPLAMSTFNPRTFTTPGLLRSIKAELLLRFFAPYRAYFDPLGAHLPPDDAPEQLDFDALHAALSATDAPSPPAPLANAMATIDDLARDGCADAVERELESAGLPHVRPKDVEDADFIVATWLRYPDLVERVNARHFAFGARTYDSFKVEDTQEVPRFTAPDTPAVATLTEHVAARFAHVYPADTFRANFYPDGSGGRFIIRHGGPLVREGVVDEQRPAQSDTRVFRRELFDVIVYSPADRELRIHARSKRDCDLYTRAFGSFLFNNEEAFPDAHTYTLQPLVKRGRDALACVHIEGMRSVKLTEFTVAVSGAIKETMTRHATDVFEIPAIRDQGIPADCRLLKARFEFLFTDARRARAVTVVVPNKAKYKRDTDGELVEKWLHEGGFVLETYPAAPAERDALVAEAP